MERRFFYRADPQQTLCCVARTAFEAARGGLCEDAAQTAERDLLVVTLDYPLRFSQGLSNIYTHIVEGDPALNSLF